MNNHVLVCTTLRQRGISRSPVHLSQDGISGYPWTECGRGHLIHFWILRSNHIFGMGEARQFTFVMQIDLDEY